MRLLFALVGLAIGFAVPAFAQQTNAPDPQLRQLLQALIQKFEDAYNHNDAVALAALFGEEAVLITQNGPVGGRQAIEKWYADHFQGAHFSNTLITVDQDSPHIIGTDAKEIWATGGWSATIKGQNFGPTQIKGFWSVIRGGDDWKIQMLTTNVTPAEVATPSPTASPSSQ